MHCLRLQQRSGFLHKRWQMHSSVCRKGLDCDTRVMHWSLLLAVVILHENRSTGCVSEVSWGAEFSWSRTELLQQLVIEQSKSQQQ
jgi:hypothetical protein